MIAKESGASLAFYALLGTVGAVWSSGVRFFTPLGFFSQPPEFHAWLVGMLAGELCYARGLFLSYRSVAYVQAFRQIGLLFGLLEGVFVLGERCTAPKVAGTLLILAGLAVSVL